MNEKRQGLRLLAPLETKPKLDAMKRDVDEAAGFRLSRRHALGLGGLMLLAAGCGSTSTGNNASGGSSQGAAAGSLTGKPMENHLEIYNWSQYDAASTFAKFKQLPAVKKAGLTLHETFYSSNDELLAKLNAGGTQYDIIVPSQNAVAQLIQEGKLMKLDTALLPNLKYLDPSFRKASYDPTGEYHVIKDYGITMIFYNNKIVKEHPTTMLDFYNLLPKYGPKRNGPDGVAGTNLLDGAEEVVPLALMALGLDPNTDKASDFDKVTNFLMGIRKGVNTISSSNYITDAINGLIFLGQGWNGDVRRIVDGRKKQGDITPVLLNGMSEIWADNWCVPTTAPDPVAAHAWINWLLTPSTAVAEMNYHNYAIPIPQALSQVPASLRTSPLFNVSKKYTDNYKYILNVSPQVVQKRTQIYTQFRAA